MIPNSEKGFTLEQYENCANPDMMKNKWEKRRRFSHGEVHEETDKIS